MKIVLRLASPRDEKERLFQVEASVNDLKNPGEAHFYLDGKEYLLEICFDNLKY